MQRLLTYGRDFATSAPFTVPAGARIKVWLVREDTQRNPAPRDRVEIQLQDQTTLTWTTVHYLDHNAPSYTIGPDSEDLTYRVYRLDQMHSIAVDRSEPSADAVEGEHATPTNFVPPNQITVDDTDPPVSCSELKPIFADDPNDGNRYGVQVTYPAAAATDFGALSSADIHGLFDPAQVGAFSFVQDQTTGDVTFHVESDGVPSLATFENAVISLLNPDGSVASNHTIALADIVSPTEINKVLPGVPVLGPDTWLAVCPVGTAYAPPPPIANSGRFTLDQNDIPARLSATGFDPDAPFEEVRLYAVEGGNVIPLTYDESGDPIRLIDSFQAFTIVAPGEYEWRRTDYSNISVYLNTGWAA